MAISKYRLGTPGQWLILALALYLLVTAFAVLWVSVRNADNSASIRLEAQRGPLISDMMSAVQVEAERAGGFQSGPSTPLADDPAMLGAIASFGEAAGSLKQMTPDSEQQSLRGVVTAHTEFVASIAAIDVHVQSGQDAMSFYHDNTQILEAALRSGLQDLQLASSAQLQKSIDDATGAETLLKWALPMLLLGGIVATVYLIRMQASKRRIATLEHLVEVKGEVIAAVSHELRTPLTAVRGFADVLLESGSDVSASDKAKMIATIAEQSEEVSAIVEDLLVAARADIGELTVAAVPVDLRAQTAQVLETLDQGHSIVVVGTVSKARGDPGRVRQILRNLITNAMRYGGDHIRVELDSHSDALASLVVKDDGDAISAEDRERIFKPYERAQNHSDEAGSIGLGLAVSQRLAHLMGGNLTYRHQNGHSIFELTLPLVAQTGLDRQDSAAATAR